MKGKNVKLKSINPKAANILLVLLPNNPRTEKMNASNASTMNNGAKNEPPICPSKEVTSGRNIINVDNARQVANIPSIELFDDFVFIVLFLPFANYIDKEAFALSFLLNLRSDSEHMVLHKSFLVC